MRWNLRLAAAERGIWKSADMRRRLAAHGIEISAGKMSGMWASTPTTIRLEDLDGICAVLNCTPSDLLIPEPEKVAAAARAAAEAAQQAAKATATGDTDLPVIRPRLGRNRTLPPA
jgi:DNA-binding Xre family transcriptional regulator